MPESEQKLIDFFELVGTYPSPHNGQPIRLKRLSDNQFEVYFQRERGLQSADISFTFSFVSMGVFMEFAEAAARALGHTLTYQTSLPQVHNISGEGAIMIASFSMAWHSSDPDESLLHALHFRQTSRKKYFEGLLPDLAGDIKQIANQQQMSLAKLSAQQATQAIWLNQRAVFDDMFDPAVRQELDHWLRYSRQQKESTGDGLAYDCMELNGPLMNYIVHHPGWLRAPVLSGFIRQYYTRTMSDDSDVFYMMAPFQTNTESFAVGQVIMRIWLALSMQEYYLHPFGTIMSNDAAHKDFLKLVGVTNESRDNYLVFIFRAGKSAVPARSVRLAYDEHLMMR